MPLTAPEFLKPHLAQPVAILGGGASGEGVRALLAALGEHVVFSPGFASFDLLRHYEDRGDQFERLAREVGARAASLR